MLTYRFNRSGSGAVLTVFLAASALLGQETTATLVGNVTDPSGAAIAGVAIRATNLLNNAVRETKSDAGGSYTLPFIPAGEYAITAAAAGFQTQKVEHLTLQVQQSARVDFKMTVGNVNESIEVAANA